MGLSYYTRIWTDYISSENIELEGFLGRHYNEEPDEPSKK